jgi:hypothetical protein
VDFLDALIYVAPVTVSIYAVWLGFYYQRKLADREKLRNSYIEVFLGLGRMLDQVELLEGVKYADWLLGYQKLPDGSPRPEVIDEYADRIWQLSIRLGFFTDSAEPPRRMPDGKFAIQGQSPMRLAQMIVDRYNRAQTEVREANLGVVLGSPASYSPAGLIRPNHLIGRIQEEATLALDGLNRNVPLPVDWDRLTRLTVDAQTEVHRILGGPKDGTVAVVQYRERFNWPPEMRPLPPKRAPFGDVMTPFEGPSFSAWMRGSKKDQRRVVRRSTASREPKGPEP